MFRQSGACSQKSRRMDTNESKRRTEDGYGKHTEVNGEYGGSIHYRTDN